MPIALIILPNFLLIVLGFTLHRWGGFTRPFWSQVERLIYFLLFPALLFRALAKTPIDLGTAAPLVLAGLLTMCLGMLLSYLAKYLFKPSPPLFASGFQCAFRFNSYVGLAIASGWGGQPGIAALALLVGTMIPPANIASVWALAKHGEGNALRELIRNPLIIATLGGMAFSLSGLSLPAWISGTLSPIGDAALPMGLLSVGAGLKMQEAVTADNDNMPRNNPVMFYWLAVKLLALPVIAWLIGRALQLPALYAQMLILFAALPPASSAYILAARMGGDPVPVAKLITWGTLLSMLTIPLWILVFG
ncbi:MAG: AEC family transporter [Burkholderiales bacterium]